MSTTRPRRRTAAAPLATFTLLLTAGLPVSRLEAQGCGPASWTTTVAQQSGYYGWTVRNIGDVDDDGREDVMVGAPLVGAPGRVEGTVFAYYGRAAGPSTTADWQASGDLPSSAFGHEIAGIGDVNGDGVDDVAVAAPHYNGGAGAVFVWHGEKTTGINGGVAGTAANAAWRCDGSAPNTRLGWSIAGVGDVNGDGCDDLLIGAPEFRNDPTTFDEGAVFLYYGSPGAGLNGGIPGDPSNAGWMAEGDFLSGKLGINVAAAGDMNNDGIDDFAVAARQAPGYLPFSGFVWLFHGATGARATGLGTSIPIGGGDANYDYGSAMAAGDFDFDGMDELAIGVPGDLGASVGAGAVVVWKGASPTQAWSREADAHSGQFGKSLAAGDYDGDGFDDLLVGSPTWGDPAAGISVAGQATLFRGDATQLLHQDPAWTCSSGQNQSQFGRSVALADLNGDGGAERLVSTPYHDVTFGDQGMAWMWLGTPGPTRVVDSCPNPTPDLTIEAPPIGTRYRGHFGRSVANAGDVNGDMVDDVIVAGPNYGASEGAVFVFHGVQDGGLNPTPAFVFTDPALRNLGISVAGAGDVNDDGFDDVIIGATGWRPSYQYVPGGVWLFYGSANGLSATDPSQRWTATSPITPDQFGFCVAGVGDVNDDGHDDIMVGAIGYKRVFGNDPFQDVLPRVYFWFGGPLGPVGGNPGVPGNADWYAESDQLMDGLGRVIVGGDIDNDDCSDVILGAPFRDFSGGGLDYGMMWSYRGSAAGFNRGMPGALGFPGDADDHYIGSQDGENLGWSLSSADLNADGFADLILGSPGYSDSSGPRNGKVTLLWGTAGPIVTPSSCEVTGDRPYAYFGFSVAGTRDANGDGIDDYLVGAWRLSNTRQNQGRVYLYLGDPVACPLPPQWHATGTTAGELMGASVAGADVDGDGVADILTGSPYYDLPPFNENGLLTVWHGSNRTVLNATPVVTAGETLTWDHLGGAPFAPIVLAIVDVNGTPTFAWLLLDMLDGQGCWSLPFQVPGGLAGIDMTFKTWTVDVRGRIVQSNPALVQFR